GPSLPRASTVSISELCSRAAVPSSKGCAAAAGGVTHSSPCSDKGRVLRKGEQTAIGYTEEQTSCTKPGRVNSADRTPPPGTSDPSSTTTDRPAWARRMAAASPLGPAPTTIASVLGSSGLDI